MFGKKTAARGPNPCAALALTVAMASPAALALDVDAGDYTALPPGTNLFLAYSQFAQRDALYANGSKQRIDAGLDSSVGILRGVHFTSIGGYTVDPQFLLPFGKLEANDDLAMLGDSSGVGDLILAATVWLVNDANSNRYFGITPFVYVPIGDYDRNDALNLGENRWKFTLQAGYITGLGEQLSLDLIGDVTLYGQNDDYGAARAELEQDPSFQAQTHLRYSVQPNWDLRAGVSYSIGGETEIEGIAQDDEARVWKMTIGTAWFPAPTWQVMANYGRDLSVENGFKEAHRVNLRLLKVF